MTFSDLGRFAAAARGNVRFRSKWTERRVWRLVKLAERGLSALDIALELGGVTRDGVTEKCRRLGVHLKGKPGRKRVTHA